MTLTNQPPTPAMAAFSRLDDQTLGMLAYDIGDKVFGCGDYPMLDDVDPDQLRAALPAFLRALGLDVPDSPAAERENTEPGADAATWTPEPAPAEPYQPPKYGRVRVYPLYVFAATCPTDPEVDEIHIADLDKQGLEWAKAKAVSTAAGTAGTVGRYLRRETARWQPYAGTPRDAKPW